MAGRNSIYEVFRACRLCGGGGGYKMPIVNLEDELDMRHKIRETVRVEVHQDDKMPPLICELCVDKVNDYFEFLEMCRATDSRTRRRLGLQPAPVSVSGTDPGDCILGVTEPLFVNDDSNDEPLSRQKNKLIIGEKGKKPIAGPASKKNAIPIISIKRTGPKDFKTGLPGLKIINGDEPGPSRSSRSGRRAPTPPPSPPARRPRRDDSDTRRSWRDDSNTRRSKGEDINTRRSRGDDSNTRRSLRDDSKDKGKGKTVEKKGKEPEKKGKEPEKKGKPDLKKQLAAPKPPTRYGKAKLPGDSLSLLKLKEKEKERASTKRVKEEDHKSPKRIKLAAKLERRPEKRRAASPPPRAEAKKPARESATHPCALCPAAFANAFRLNQHMRSSHAPTFTAERLACDACGEWFVSVDEATTHHRWHRSHATYSCRLCSAEFKQYSGYNKHLSSKQCVPSSEVPDVKCEVCWAYFATRPLLDTHKCRGEDYRPGGACSKCGRKYAIQKTLRQHETTCFQVGPKSRRGGAVNISPELAERLLPMKVRVARCDPVLARVKTEAHYNVAEIKEGFDLVRSVSYPYISSVRSIKRELFDLDGIKHEMDFEDSLIDYESYTDSDSEPEYIQTIEQGAPRMVTNPFARKKKTVDALSTLSIKTIFSQQMLGRKKVQRKRKRRPIVKPEIKDEAEKEAEDGDKNTSIENVENGEIRAEGEISQKDKASFADDDDEDVRKTVDDLITGTVENNEKNRDAISESEMIAAEKSNEDKLELDEDVSKITDHEKQDTDNENGLIDLTESKEKTDTLSSDIKTHEKDETKRPFDGDPVFDHQEAGKEEKTDQESDNSAIFNENSVLNNELDTHEKANKSEDATPSNNGSQEKPNQIDDKPFDSVDNELSCDGADTKEKCNKVDDVLLNAVKTESTLVTQETGSQKTAESAKKSLHSIETHSASEKMHHIISEKDYENSENSESLDANSENVDDCTKKAVEHSESHSFSLGNFSEDNSKSIETTSIDVRLSDVKDYKACELENSEPLHSKEETSESEHKPSVSAIVSAESEAENHDHTSCDEATNKLQLESSTELENIETTSKKSDSESAKKMDDDLMNDLDNISDTEMDDMELMEELDRQIDGDVKTEQREAENNKVEHNAHPELVSKHGTEGKSKEEKSSDEKISLDELLMATGESSEQKTDDKIEAELNFGV